MKNFLPNLFILFLGTTIATVAGVLTWVIYDAEGASLLTLGGVFVTIFALVLAHWGANGLIRLLPVTSDKESK